jgi:hypothetical protein
VAPNATAIQASVGAGNPYTVVSQDRIEAGATVIASDKITDVRALAEPVRISKIAPKLTPPYNIVVGGIQFSAGTINASNGGTAFNFPRQFSSAPVVTASVLDPGIQTAVVYNVNSTGATIKQSYGAGTLSVNWFAMGPA